MATSLQLSTTITHGCKHACSREILACDYLSIVFANSIANSKTECILNTN